MKKNAIGFVFAVICGLVLPAYSAAEIIVSAPVSATVKQASKANEAMNLLGLCVVIAVVIVMLLVVGVMIYKMRSKPKSLAQTAEEPELDKFPETHLSDVPVPITHNGHNYDFYPEIAEDGRYKTFYEIEPGRFMFVATQDDLKMSLRTSFKNDQNLVTKLINQGRLRMRLY